MTKHLVAACLILLASTAWAQSMPANSAPTSAPTATTAAPSTSPLAAPAGQSAGRVVLPNTLPLASTQPTPLDAELASSIVRDARVGAVAGNPVVYLKRAAILSRLALQLDPVNATAYRMMAEADEMLGQMAEAASAHAEYLRNVDINDYLVFVGWLNDSLRLLPSAEARAGFLNTVIADAAFNDPARALAASSMGGLEEGRAETSRAMGFYEQAARLDPTLPGALSALDRLETPANPVNQMSRGLAMVQGNPLAVKVEWDLAQLAGGLGLYPQAVALFDCARGTAQAMGQPSSGAFQREYINALLDAGMADRAVKEFAGALKNDPQDMALASLLVEAYRQLGQTKEADAVVAEMNKIYAPREADARPTADMLSDLAWFYLTTRQQPIPAQKWAVKAMQSDGRDPYVQRVWGVTALGGPDAERAQATLTPLAATDPFAAGALAERAYSQGQAASAEGVLTTAAQNLPHRGPGWRYLAQIARKHNFTLPPAPGAGEAAKVFGAFNSGYFEMGLHPEQAVVVAMAPLAAQTTPGDPIIVRAKLTNTSKLPVPLGDWGLVSPKLLLEVSIKDTATGTVTLEHVTPAVWTAPRYLQPGQSVEQIIRVDSGRIWDYLIRRPLGSFELTITGILDPIDQDGKFVPRLRTVTVAPAVVARPGLSNAEDPQAYYAAMTGVSRRLLGSDVSDAMRAAEATVSLLSMSQAVRAGQVRLGEKVASNMREPELLAMLKYCLQEAPVPVRVRTLGAMRSLTLTALMVKLMAPCIGNSSPLVRARAAELLGLTGDPKYAPILAGIAEHDADGIVRSMARAFLTPAPPATAPAGK